MAKAKYVIEYTTFEGEWAEYNVGNLFADSSDVLDLGLVYLRKYEDGVCIEGKDIDTWDDLIAAREMLPPLRGSLPGWSIDAGKD